MTPLRLTRRHALEVGIGVAGPVAAGLARPAGSDTLDPIRMDCGHGPSILAIGDSRAHAIDCEQGRRRTLPHHPDLDSTALAGLGQSSPGEAGRPFIAEAAAGPGRS